MMNVCLKTDIELNVKGKVIIFKAGDLIQVDINNNIAYHSMTDFYFDIESREYAYLN